MESERAVVPYVPFKTFLTSVETFERGVPNQLDRSVWPSYSGAIQGQLLGAYRFLGLMDENLAPAAALRELAANRERRPALVRALVERHYRALIALDLTRTSPRQLDEAMRKYGLTGATHKKAMSFFLQAAQYGGLPISPLLKAKTRVAGGGHRKPAAAARAEEPPAQTETAMTRTVRLKSGGRVTLTASFDLFALGPEDRAFVFDLVDRLQRYGGA
ncbi:MAG TPA: hypothetical protein VHA11_05755 [Bryobacteraceae bacterium]|nr:hypothetical protein [Bryobacteraceae bacterium]